MSDDFFQPLENDKPWLKLAVDGFAGTGKTYTLALIAVGLHKRIGSDKPIACYDTERAAGFLLPLFRKYGIKAIHRKSRSLSDLSAFMRRCADGAADIGIIDSISHVWEDYLAAYQRKRNKERLSMEDWGIIKPIWRREFADAFVNLPAHFLMAGRAAYEYESEINDKGKREYHKAGIKMKVEGETAYEPDVLILMSRFEETMEKDKSVWREATIIKDRTGTIDGKTFRDPAYSDFEPMVNAVFDNPVAVQHSPESDAGNLFGPGEDRSGQALRREREILLDEYKIELAKKHPGQAKEDKTARFALMEQHFGSASWPRILQIATVEQLRAALFILRAPARAAADPGRTDDDDVPAFPLPTTGQGPALPSGEP